MGRLVILVATLLLVGVVGPTNAAPKMSAGECRTKVMQNPTYLDGRNRRCGKQCNAAIQRCVQSGGKLD